MNKSTVFYLILIMALMGCNKNDYDLPTSGVSVPTSISNLRRVKLVENLQFGVTAIKGIVVSDSESKNIDSKTLAVQEEGKDAAILIELDEPAPFAFGTEVSIDLKGARMQITQGELRLSGMNASAVKPTGRMVSLSPKSVTISTVKAEAAYWGPILVRLDAVSLTNGLNGSLNGEVTVDDGLSSLQAVFNENSVFAGMEAPEVAQAFIGIIRFTEEKVYVNPALASHVQAEARETIEDFENASSSNYDVKELSFKTGKWIIDGGITANTSSDPKNGTQSIRLQGTTTNSSRKGILGMSFDVQGTKKLRVSHGIYPAAAEIANVNPTTFDVEISRDGGATYSLLKRIEIDITTRTLSTDVVDVNAGKADNVRFRFVNSSTPFANNNRPRINLDDIVFEY